ncbi:tetratricopeptide repeat protein [Desulfovibrio legallii]|uniref:Sel1 repeat family protein n=1 Tax=Desulfovibrio legallii TaxID=571438 RepID=A0A1G7NAC2_9BACT|nr:tetratricopeptide repeat protein [Desulfovibrio legallii]SDF70896.1 hypothetical protein SAMN05192586_1118 [Desulfovibrio legallii]
MKRSIPALLAAVVLAWGLAAPALAADAAQTLQEAWTAYNIGQYKKVIQMVQPLASDGNPRAQVLLGRCYENGLGVDQDLATAAKWFRLAADQNDAEAQVLLAYQYELGVGLPRNEAAVADLMRRAADNGNAEARFNLALYCSQGKYGFPKDPQESFRWAKLAADQGFAQAQRYVGACYEYGVGAPQDAAEATLWYSKAAAQGLEREGNIFTTKREYTMP